MSELLQNVYGIQFYSHIHKFDIGIADAFFKKNTLLVGDFPGGSVTKTPTSNAGGPGSISGQGTRSLMLQPVVVDDKTDQIYLYFMCSSCL